MYFISQDLADLARVNHGYLSRAKTFCIRFRSTQVLHCLHHRLYQGVLTSFRFDSLPASCMVFSTARRSFSSLRFIFCLVIHASVVGER